MTTPLDRFRFLTVAALADGALDEAEKPVLLRAAEHLGIDRAQAGAVVRELMSGQEVLAHLPADPAARREVFEGMVEVVAADGRVSAEEVELFRRLAPRFGLDPAAAGALLETVQRFLEERG
ncbi:MAG: TerB family tellurite resistance protein [Planctomycetota bacterium]